MSLQYIVWSPMTVDCIKENDSCGGKAFLCLFHSSWQFSYLCLISGTYLEVEILSHSNLKCHVNVWSAQALHLFAVANGQLIYSKAGFFCHLQCNENTALFPLPYVHTCQCNAGIMKCRVLAWINWEIYTLHLQEWGVEYRWSMVDHILRLCKSVNLGWSQLEILVICDLCVYFIFQRNTCCFPEFLDSISIAIVMWTVWKANMWPREPLRWLGVSCQ